MVYFYKQYTQPTFQYRTPPLSDYSSTQPEKERHEGTFEERCRMNNRWLAYTIKKIYAYIHIQRGYVGRYIKGERVYDRGLFQDDKVLFVIAQLVFT